MMTSTPLRATTPVAMMRPVGRIASDPSAGWRLVDGTPIRLRPSSTADAEREVGYLITVPDEGGERRIGEVRLVVDGSSGCADITLEVADGWRRHGIGTMAMLALARAAAQRGLRWLRADVGAANEATLRMLQRCGFIAMPHPHDAGRTQLHLLLLPPFPGQ
jgi:GNAT superfamily N-acetyltransferase